MYMPEIKSMLNLIPLRYASYIISLFGITTGALGLILVWCVNGPLSFMKGIMLHFVPKDWTLEEHTRDEMLGIQGLLSVWLLVANLTLLYGVRSEGEIAVMVADRLLLMMCIGFIFAIIGTPAACFFKVYSCVLKGVPTSLITTIILYATIFLNVWLYFVVVVWNYEQTLKG